MYFVASAASLPVVVGVVNLEGSVGEEVIVDGGDGAAVAELMRDSEYKTFLLLLTFCCSNFDALFQTLNHQFLLIVQI